jgi:hypothetical protein
MKKIYTTILFAFSLLNLFAQPLAGLRINELVSTNSFLLSDLNNAGDWIEIYNPTAGDIDLGGFYITDDIANLTKYQIPTGNPDFTITAGSFILVWADDSATGTHANFKLSSGGETFLLVANDGSTIVDSVTFPPMAADYSWGRSVDGTGNWVEFSPSTTTPGSSNQSSSVGVNDAVNFRMNVLGNGSSNPGIVINSKINGRAIFNWVNLSGQTVETSEFYIVNGQNKLFFPEHLDKGFYFLQVILGENQMSQKVIIH